MDLVETKQNRYVHFVGMPEPERNWYESYLRFEVIGDTGDYKTTCTLVSVDTIAKDEMTHGVRPVYLDTSHFFDINKPGVEIYGRLSKASTPEEALREAINAVGTGLIRPLVELLDKESQAGEGE